jgi:chromosome segregation ATPase
MKRTYLHAASLAFAAFAVTALITGCQTAGYQKADKTGAGIAEFRTEIVNGKKAVDGTMAALDQIAVKANTDPRSAFENYSKQVANLESVAAKARKRGEAMKQSGQAYFKQWEEQMAQVKDENIRKLAQERKAKLQECFDKIREYTEPLKQQFDPWMQSLKDLQSYLANDLTVNGVAAAKKPFAAAKSDGQKVQKSMDALIEELNDLAATITPAKVQPAPAAAPAK